jgi:uncharacterized protein (DUF934 family)
MPLIKNGKVVDDVWAYVEDEHELSPGGCITVSLGRFLSEHDQLLHRNRSIGVRLSVSDDPELLVPHLDSIHVIELSFPKYTDGRALSQAQLLRRRYGYKGEIRAIGQVLRDQLRLMIRCGFDAMMIEEGDAEGVYDYSASEFTEFYQAASDTSETVFTKRHRKRQEKAAE